MPPPPAHTTTVPRCITLLILFEATAGVLVLIGGRWTEIGLIGLIGFHVGQFAFGGVLWPWATAMLIALMLLLRAERRAMSTPSTLHIRGPKHPAGVSR